MLATAGGTASLVQGMCSCKISNIIYFTSLQIRLGTAKTLPPNTSLILQAMANSFQTGTAEPIMEIKIKASIHTDLVLICNGYVL